MISNNINRLMSDDRKIAYNPASCVFVSANAGSGKTSLLVDRVLSLLLHGVAPDKILCLTFTNAAAAEMSNRVLQALGAWVMADTDELHKKISRLAGENPSGDLLAHARGLFAQVLEAPSGINIQTIHGFSQSLLKRFPLEAGISPYFTVMDERSEKEALNEARLRLFSNVRKSDKNIQLSLDALACDVSEFGFHKLMKEIVSAKRKFIMMLHNYGGIPEIERELYLRFKLSHQDNIESLLDEFFSYDETQLFSLKKIADCLLVSEKSTDKKTGSSIANWLEYPQDKAKNYTLYINAFIKDDGEPRKKIFTNEALTDENLINALMSEQTRVARFRDKLNSMLVVRHSIDVLNIAEALLAQYEAIKRNHAWMDYDDLILTACSLLTRAGMSSWVLFKLDSGIDHILVDEAQDTSPEQWMIIDALTQEFFAGQGAKDIDRSLFIVGDEKQSIYSFQGADVKELARMQSHFADSIKSSQKEIYSLALTKSYRSTDAVLQVVDAVFSSEAAKEGVTFSGGALEHLPTRSGHPGLVELWPVVRQSEDENESSLSPTVRLVRHIADTIQGWIKCGEAEAGDIMILLRSRANLADRLVKALKRRGVPVAGSDRMELNDNLAVQDLIAFGQVLLLPEDDLTLAACLKSPVFNLDEDELFKLAYGRGEKSLWQRLSEMAEFEAGYELLKEMRALADYTPPFELYSHLLDNLGVRARFIGRMGEECADPIDEFMQQALLYERSHPPSLQGFMHWLSNSSSEIKRDMEQAKNSVRIMTIHGAKGLQSKIVILPDTTGVPREMDSLLWFQGIALRSLSSKQDNANFKKLRGGNLQESLSEYRRLLYVALTRAEDRLYICGAIGRDKLDERSWYHHIKSGMEKIGESCKTPTGEGLRVGCHQERNESNLQSNNENMASFAHDNSDGNDFLFLQKTVPFEPSPNKPLVPSKLSGELPPPASPLAGKDVYAVGKFIHMLMQYLPNQKGDRQDAAQAIARKFFPDIMKDQVENAINQTLSVISNPEFEFLFGKDSQAEVPIIGNIEIDGKTITVSGQIDRLYMDNEKIWIVDFKSNQIPPKSQSNIPVSYIRQLALYRLLMQRIAPKKTINCALLWTANAKLDVLPDGLLDEWPISSYI